MTTHTMDCTDIKALLSGLIDDQVDRDARHAAERHLAECAACRALIDEAEQLDAGLARDAAMTTSRDEQLPRDFEAGVLARTVLAGNSRSRGLLWINWTGWLAAAASLSLAVTLWVLQNNQDRPSARTFADRGSTRIESATGDDGADSGARLASFHPTFGLPPEQYESVVFSPQRTIAADARASIDANASIINARRQIADADPQLLDAALDALSIVMQTDDDSWSDDADMVQRVIEYDELIPRLDAAQRLAAAADRPALSAARAALHRIAEGFQTVQDLRDLRDVIRRLDVLQRLRQITEPSPPAAAL